MAPAAQFEFVLILIVAIVGLVVVARWLRLPPAVALIVGGVALAFVPGLPTLSFDPALVLVLFLPPLLMEGAFYTVWRDFRRNLTGIFQLAVGAVVFTVLVVGCVVHWVVPDLPWAACFALGAVVSPPDAVSARAVLSRARLPRRVLVLLEGESLLNDAAGLVLFRFAVAAAMTGAFSLREAVLSFGYLLAGGVVIGAAAAFLWMRLMRLFNDETLPIIASLLLPWGAYILAEAVGVSGVIAVVTSGLMLGWYQHELFSANGRTRGMIVWSVVTFLLEAFVFILIGLSLRGVLARFGGMGGAAQSLTLPVLAVVATVIVARFAWIFSADCLMALTRRRRPSPAAAAAMSWAGMRGVVTLAIALSVPDSMPGRDLILASAFAVIFATVLVQGTTLGPLIRLLRLDRAAMPVENFLDGNAATARMAAAQLAALEAMTLEDGSPRHPSLLEQFRFRARAAERYSQDATDLAADRTAHFDALLAAIAAGRDEVLRLHRSGQIHDNVLLMLERELDLQEISASQIRAR